jgi:hypothetical protein
MDDLLLIFNLFLEQRFLVFGMPLGILETGKFPLLDTACCRALFEYPIFGFGEQARLRVVNPNNPFRQMAQDLVMEIEKAI